jgi:hypothetical protein
LKDIDVCHENLLATIPLDIVRFKEGGEVIF